MYSYGSPHTAAQKQDDQHERTFSSYVRIQVVVLKTYLGRWTIGRSGERGSGISVLPARYDDDDDDCYMYKCIFNIYFLFNSWTFWLHKIYLFEPFSETTSVVRRGETSLCSFTELCPGLYLDPGGKFIVSKDWEIPTLPRSADYCQDTSRKKFKWLL